MEVPQEISRMLASRAKSLELLGLYEVGWSKADAMEVLRELESSTVPILGGDVYKISPSGLTPLYDNWSCEREPGESQREYAERSRRAAMSFLLNYPGTIADEALFVLVFG